MKPDKEILFYDFGDWWLDVTYYGWWKKRKLKKNKHVLFALKIYKK